MATTTATPEGKFAAHFAIILLESVGRQLHWRRSLIPVPPRFAPSQTNAHHMATTVLWAQRSSNVDAEKNFVYLTINVPDVPKIDLNLTSTGLTFEGYSNTHKKTYKLELEFYAEIDKEESKVNHTARDVEMKLRKKDLGEEYWPRLLKDAKKAHWLKTDFDKWVDEDEQNEAAEEDFSNFGGGGPGGMGGGMGE